MKTRPNLDEVAQFIDKKAGEIGLNLQELRGSCRRGELSMARGVIAKLLRDKFNLTYEEIGEVLHKERSAITRAINKTELALSMYEKLSGDKLHVRAPSIWSKLFGVHKQ